MNAKVLLFILLICAALSPRLVCGQNSGLVTMFAGAGTAGGGIAVDGARVSTTVELTQKMVLKAPAARAERRARAHWKAKLESRIFAARAVRVSA